MRWTIALALAVALSACAPALVSETALCRGTAEARTAHGVALLTPPTDMRDFETGELLLEQLAVGCEED